MITDSLADTEFVVRSIAQTAVENEAEFCELDSVVGDGDFGYSLARGFEKVIEDWDGYSRTDSGAFLQAVATTITSRIGGTSGPLWGTAFLRASMVAKGLTTLTGTDAVSMLRAAIDGIAQRGKAAVGDKTLLDALVPAADELAAAIAQGGTTTQILDRVAAATRVAADGTTMMRAMRGRASYSGDRSMGSPDAGATAVAVIIERLSDEWKSR
jgi:dihydroxyacetone kinase phosphoprotein-dependent L subunit